MLRDTVTQLAHRIAKAMVRNPKRTLLIMTVVNVVIALSLIVPTLAQEEVTTGAGILEMGKFIGAGVAVAGSTIGAGIGLLGATSAGLAALVERPELSVWVLILAGLAEGVAIYGIIIAIMILGA